MLNLICFCLIVIYLCFVSVCITILHKLKFFHFLVPPYIPYDDDLNKEPRFALMFSTFLLFPILMPIFITCRITCWLFDKAKAVLEDKGVVE